MQAAGLVPNDHQQQQQQLGEEGPIRQEEVVADGANVDHPVADEEEEALPAIMGQDDPRRMLLTRDEHAWALDIKFLVERVPDLDNLPDFMYAQLGIVCQNNLDDALRRAYGLQAFREEYKIHDSLEEGRRLLHSLVTVIQPLQFLSFSFSQGDGTYVLVHDVTKFETKHMTTPRKANEWFAAAYYMQTVLNPDLESVRKGCICCVECEGFDVTKKQDFKIFQKMFSELMTSYPFRGVCKHYHTGLFCNLIISAFRKLLPKSLRDTFQIGLKFDCRLDEAFLVPTVAIANQRFLSRVDETLMRRYINESTFSLSQNGY